ncbi:MAG: 30S ribosomal protein S3, partial [Planctomycetes bacterium]|nr:30S ribosomal protein S3 [Planctomycetota bacterium]
LVQDQHIRRFVKKEFEFAGIPKIEIERDRERVHVFLYTSRPGVIIGRKGAKVDKLKEDLESICGQEVKLEIREITSPEIDAQLIAESIAQQLLKRAAFRRVMKTSIRSAIDRGALGVKVAVAGRLAGSDMARRESFSEGTIPLQTLQAHIEYGFTEARTTYGSIGVKCWVYLGQYSEEGDGHGSHAKKG